MLIGYGRAVFADQDLARQQLLLQEAGCEEIYVDNAETSDKKPGLSMALSRLQEGDTLVVPWLDRLGRKMKEVVVLIKTLDSQNIHFCSLREGINTASDNGAFLQAITALAAMDEALLKEHTRISMVEAHQNGGKTGRKRRMTKGKVEAAKALFSRGMPPAEIADYFGVSIPTLYRWCPASERM